MHFLFFCFFDEVVLLRFLFFPNAGVCDMCECLVYLVYAPNCVFVITVRLSLENILNVCERVTNWQELGIQLKVPRSVLESIKAECGGDVKRAKSSLIKYWLSGDSLASWQKLAVALMESGYGELYSDIMKQDPGTDYD